MRPALEGSCEGAGGVLRSWDERTPTKQSRQQSSVHQLRQRTAPLQRAQDSMSPVSTRHMGWPLQHGA